MQIYSALCSGKPVPKARYAAFRTIYEPFSLSSRQPVLDPGALVLLFPSPNTVTGEDVLEFHVHGGPAIVKAVLAAIGKCNTSNRPVRYAEPGEFTRRAFLNDRVNLTQVEALGDTLSAVTEEQRRLSVQGTASGLGQRYESWRQLLLHARGELEALIDFSEDQHFDESPASLAASVAVQVEALARTISFHTANAVRGELLRNGIRLSLIGAPNVGKSSLLNQIVGRNAAIVNKEAGTTRDVVEVGVDLGGFYCRLADTAGLRQTTLARIVGEVEQEGIKRAKETALQSDVVILVLSIESVPNQELSGLQLDTEVIATAAQLLQDGKEVIVAVNKMDRGVDSIPMAERLIIALRSALPGLDAENVFYISCQDAKRGVVQNSANHNVLTNHGHTATAAPNPEAECNDPGNFHYFLNGLVRKFQQMTSARAPDGDETNASIWQDSLGVTERQRSLLETCSVQLQTFLEQVRPDTGIATSNDDEVLSHREEEIDIVVAAESLRAAADCLGKITGRGEAGDVEEVLGVVFEKYARFRTTPALGWSRS